MFLLRKRNADIPGKPKALPLPPERIHVRTHPLQNIPSPAFPPPPKYRQITPSGCVGSTPRRHFHTRFRSRRRKPQHRNLLPRIMPIPPYPQCFRRRRCQKRHRVPCQMRDRLGQLLHPRMICPPPIADRRIRPKRNFNSLRPRALFQPPQHPQSRRIQPPRLQIPRLCDAPPLFSITPSRRDFRHRITRSPSESSFHCPSQYRRNSAYPPA